MNNVGTASDLAPCPRLQVPSLEHVQLTLSLSAQPRPAKQQGSWVDQQVQRPKILAQGPCSVWFWIIILLGHYRARRFFIQYCARLSVHCGAPLPTNCLPTRHIWLFCDGLVLSCFLILVFSPRPSQAHAATPYRYERQQDLYSRASCVVGGHVVHESQFAGARADGAGQ